MPGFLILSTFLSTAIVSQSVFEIDLGGGRTAKGYIGIVGGSGDEGGAPGTVQAPGSGAGGTGGGGSGQGAPTIRLKTSSGITIVVPGSGFGSGPVAPRPQDLSSHAAKENFNQAQQKMAQLQSQKVILEAINTRLESVIADIQNPTKRSDVLDSLRDNSSGAWLQSSDQELLIQAELELQATRDRSQLLLDQISRDQEFFNNVSNADSLASLEEFEHRGYRGTALTQAEHISWVEGGGEVSDRKEIREQFFDSQGLYQRGIDPRLLAGINLKTSIISVDGQTIRSIANSGILAQSFGSTTQVSQLGSDLLVASQIADSLIAAGESAGYAMLSGLSHTSSFVRGVVDGGVNFVTGTLDLAEALVFHGDQVVVSIASAIIHYDKTYEALGHWADNKWDEFKSADSDKRAHMLGELTFEVGSAFIPVGAVAKGTVKGLEATRLAAVTRGLTGRAARKIETEMVEGLSRLEMIQNGASLKAAGLQGDVAQKLSANLRSINERQVMALRAIENESPGWIADEILSNPDAVTKYSKLADQARRTEIVTDFNKPFESLAVSDLSKEGLDIRPTVPDRPLYRIIRVSNVDPADVSKTVDAQFWSLKPADDVQDFGRGLGVPGDASAYDLEVTGRLKPGTPFVVQRSKSIGHNPGGDWEVVVPPYGVDVPDIEVMPKINPLKGSK